MQFCVNDHYSVVLQSVNDVAGCSRVTRSWTVAMARKRHLATAVSRRSPYWMRCPRAVHADTNTTDTADAGMLRDLNQDTGAGCDGCRFPVSTLHASGRGTELSTSSSHPHKIQASKSHGASSRSSRLSVKGSADGRKLIGTEAAESKSNEGHSSSSGYESICSRLHGGDGGECSTCITAHSSDCAGVLSGPTNCNHSSCPRLSSATAHVDRPWVCTRTLLTACQWMQLILNS